MTRRRHLRALCPLGCLDGYVGDENGERIPCPHCQAERRSAMDAAREACGPPPAPEAVTPIAALSPDERAERLNRRAAERGLSTIRGDKP